jgi:hypothetical protein
MANRVLIGNRATGGYGLYVSKAASNVLTCARKDLLFDSSQARAGEVYAGGSLSSLGNTTQNFLSTGSKANLGYIPLVITTEDRRGEYEDTYAAQDGTEQFYSSRIDVLEFTTSTIHPKSLGSPAGQNFDFSANQIIGSRFSGQTCTNLKFMVLKIPLAYGYMNSTYFG